MVDGAHGHFKVDTSTCFVWTVTDDLVPIAGHTADRSTKRTNQTSLDGCKKAESEDQLKSRVYHDDEC